MSLTNAQNALLAKKNDIPFFADLANEEVLTVAQDVNFLRLDKGDLIFEQGDCSTAIYYVVRGSVEIEIRRVDENGNEEFVPVANLPRKSFFGEMAFITGDPRSARAVSAENDTSVLTFNMLNDVDNSDIKTIRALALVYFYFAQDLAAKLKITSANYAKIKTVDDVPYDDLVTLIVRAKEAIIAEATNRNVLTLDEELVGSIAALFPVNYDASAQREVIKTAVSEAFALNEKDLIIFAKNRIVVRLFQELAVPPPEEPKTVSLSESIGDPEALAYIDELFSDPAVFEKDVLLCEDAAKREVIVRTAMNEVLTRLPQRRYLSFLHMESYSHFRLAKAVEGLEKFLEGAARLYLSRDCGLEGDQLAAVMGTDKYRAFLRNQALDYVKRFKPVVSEMIADTFTAAILKAPGPNDIPAVIGEAIKGTLEYAPIFSKPGGGMVAGRADQVKMRLTQALKEREKKNADLVAEVERCKKAVVNAEKNSEAMRLAPMMSKDRLSQYSHEQLRDIIINEEGQFNDQKRIMQFIPAGECTLVLRETADRGVRSARNDVAKEEYKRTFKFFDNLHMNNTPKVLEQKRLEIDADLPKAKASLAKAEAALAEAEAARIENFDEGLKKIHEAIMYNLGRKIG